MSLPELVRKAANQRFLIAPSGRRTAKPLGGLASAQPFRYSARNRDGE